MEEFEKRNSNTFGLDTKTKCLGYTVDVPVLKQEEPYTILKKGDRTNRKRHKTKKSLFECYTVVN